MDPRVARHPSPPSSPRFGRVGTAAAGIGVARRALTWLGALALIGAATPGPLPAAPQTGAPTLTLQCAKGSRVVSYHEDPDPFERTTSQATRGRGVACVDSEQRLNGAVFLVRPETSEAVIRLIGAGPWRVDALQWLGQFRDGRAVGSWQQLGAKGARFAAVALDAEGSGAFVQRDDAGTVRVAGRLLRGQREGTWRWTDAHGVLRAEASYAAGKLRGESVVYLETGRPETTAHWVDHQRDGLFTSWWPSGVKRWEGTYVREIRDGRWCNWSEGGQLLGCNELHLGDGDWHEWTQTGELSVAGRLRADRRDGVWSSYFETGALRTVATYAGGQVVAGTSKTYDVEGQGADRVAIGTASRRVVFGNLGPGGIVGGIRGTLGGAGSRGTGHGVGVLGGGVRAGLTLTIRAVGGVPPPTVVPGTLGLVEALVVRCPPGGATSGSTVQASWFGRVVSNGTLATLASAPIAGGGTPAPPAWVACAETRLRALRFERHRSGAVEIQAELRVP